MMVKTLSFAVALPVVVLLAVGCEPSERPADQADTGADSDAAADTGADTDAPTDDTGATGDVGSETADGCGDLRRPNDYKQAHGRCWDPPQDYCSQGGSTWVVRGCKPDFSLCCTFATSCIACGWHDCNNAPDARCETAPLDTGACEDPQVRPDFEAAFCFD